jgi:hypothetical protein
VQARLTFSFSFSKGSLTLCHFPFPAALREPLAFTFPLSCSWICSRCLLTATSYSRCKRRFSSSRSSASLRPDLPGLPLKIGFADGIARFGESGVARWEACGRWELTEEEVWSLLLKVSGGTWTWESGREAGTASMSPRKMASMHDGRVSTM